MRVFSIQIQRHASPRAAHAKALHSLETYGLLDGAERRREGPYTKIRRHKTSVASRRYAPVERYDNWSSVSGQTNATKYSALHRC